MSLRFPAEYQFNAAYQFAKFSGFGASVCSRKNWFPVSPNELFATRREPLGRFPANILLGVRVGLDR